MKLSTATSTREFADNLRQLFLSFLEALLQVCHLQQMDGNHAHQQDKGKVSRKWPAVVINTLAMTPCLSVRQRSALVFPTLACVAKRCSASVALASSVASCDANSATLASACLARASAVSNCVLNRVASASPSFASAWGITSKRVACRRLQYWK